MVLILFTLIQDASDLFQMNDVWSFRTFFVLTGGISLFPLVGSMLGGTQVLISGPCFNSTSQVVCDFDSMQTSGRLLSNQTALCVSPTFYKVGRIPLRVSLDGGVTFLFKGTFTIGKLLRSINRFLYSSLDKLNGLKIWRFYYGFCWITVNNHWIVFQ